MKKILCVVLMGVLGLSGSLWAVDTPKRERPFFENEGEAGELETKDEPAEDDIDMVALSVVNYQENGGGTSLNLESIPDEVWMAILEFLDLSDLGRLAQVSQFFHRLIQDEAVLGPREVWSHYEGLSRFPGDDQSALNGKLVNFLRDWEAMPSLLEEHFFYLLQRFVEWGAALDAGDYYGYSPLHWAVRSGHVDVVRLLLDRGAALDVKGSRRMTPLHWAVIRGHVDVVRLLLDRGAALDVRDLEGRTPLDRAAMNGHVDVVRLLLDRGATLDVRRGGLRRTPPLDLRRMTPFDWAVRSGHEEIVRLLEDHYNDGGNVADAPELAPLAPLRQAEEVGNVEGDGNLIDVRNIHDNGVGDWTREQLLGALVLVGALTYSTGCNLL